MSLVATPHVHRKFMRHSQLQQQVTYTHTPDAEVDKAIVKAKEKLFGEDHSTLTEGRNREQEVVDRISFSALVGVFDTSGTRTLPRPAG
jgi:hypothetical protein